MWHTSIFWLILFHSNLTAYCLLIYDLCMVHVTDDASSFRIFNSYWRYNTPLNKLALLCKRFGPDTKKRHLKHPCIPTLIRNSRLYFKTLSEKIMSRGAYNMFDQKILHLNIEQSRSPEINTAGFKTNELKAVAQGSLLLHQTCYSLQGEFM